MSSRRSSMSWLSLHTEVSSSWRTTMSSPRPRFTSRGPFCSTISLQEQRCREMVEQKAHRVVNLGRGEDMGVPPDEDTSVCRLRQPLDESRQLIHERSQQA